MSAGEQACRSRADLSHVFAGVISYCVQGEAGVKGGDKRIGSDIFLQELWT